MKFSTVEQAVQNLNLGEVIGLPTETVYGLAAKIDNPVAIEKIFKIKQRPFFDPLIVHVASNEQARSLVVEWPIAAQVLSDIFWPGPLTLVLKKNNLVSDLITSGLDSVGLRWPNHPIAQEIIKKARVPLAAPSANRFGKTSPTMAAHVYSEFPNQNLAIVDGGSCQVGIESTVVLLKKEIDLTWSFSILRPGFISLKQIKVVFDSENIKINYAESIDKKQSPGHLKHHYMPAKPLIVSLRENMSDAEILKIYNEKISLLPDQVDGVKILKPAGYNLKITHIELPSDSHLAARLLYSELRIKAEEPGDILLFKNANHNTKDELWSAIFERISKAATLIVP